MQLFTNNLMVQQRINWLYDNWKGPIPIEQVFDPYNDIQQWYYIPGYNGYEISNYGNVRSMKNFKRYQFGTLCRENNGKYELSTNNNERVKVDRQELFKLASEGINKYIVYRYPRSTMYSDIGSRNQRKFIDFEKVSNNKRKIKRKPVPIRKEETYFPKFSVKSDNIKCPIYFEKEQGEILW